MTIGYLKRKAKEYEKELLEREKDSPQKHFVSLGMIVVDNFIQYLEENK